MANNKHVYSGYIDYQDTDAGQVVYHASYINFAERARSALIRDLAEKSFTEDRAFIVNSLSVKYLKPLKLGDKFDLVTSVKELKKASVIFLQKFYLSDGLYTVIEITLVNIDIGSNKIAKLSQSLSKKLQNYMED